MARERSNHRRHQRRSRPGAAPYQPGPCHPHAVRRSRRPTQQDGTQGRQLSGPNLARPGSGRRAPARRGPVLPGTGTGHRERRGQRAFDDGRGWSRARFSPPIPGVLRPPISRPRRGWWPRNATNSARSG